MDLPPGWIREISDKGRVVYISPPPKTKIYSASKLQEYQKAGRFIDLDARCLDFRKTENKKLIVTPKESTTFNNV